MLLLTDPAISVLEKGAVRKVQQNWTDSNIIWAMWAGQSCAEVEEQQQVESNEMFQSERE